MSDAIRRKIRHLRALAASTTFPAEAESARAKADQLEASLGCGTRTADAAYRQAAQAHADYAKAAARMEEQLAKFVAEEMRRRMEKSLFGMKGFRAR